jgi:hypothetical protein
MTNEKTTVDISDIALHDQLAVAEFPCSNPKGLPGVCNQHHPLYPFRRCTGCHQLCLVGRTTCGMIWCHAAREQAGIIINKTGQLGLL